MKTGVLQPGAKPLGIGLSGALRGLVHVSGRNETCIVKKCDTLEELAAECFCATLARELSLNAPEPILVQNGSELWFGGMDTTYPNLVTLYNFDPNNPDDNLLRILCDDLAIWANCGRLLAFDLLIDNADRHLGNLLFDGVDYTPIDHSRTLGIWPSNQKLVKFFNNFINSFHRPTLNASTTAAAYTFPVNAFTVSGDTILSDPQISSFRNQFVQFVGQNMPTIASKGATLL